MGWNPYNYGNAWAELVLYLTKLTNEIKNSKKMPNESRKVHA